jgi:hypothetical protein
LLLSPAILSSLLLAAHFYRADMIALAASGLLLPTLLLIRRAWIARLFQVVLAVGAVEWGRTLLMLVQMRIAFGLPWGRLALIIGTVGVFTLLSALVFESAPLRRRYR